MRRKLATLATILVPAFLMAAVSGRLTPVHVVAWTVFFAALFLRYPSRRSSPQNCLRKRA